MKLWLVYKRAVLFLIYLCLTKLKNSKTCLFFINLFLFIPCFQVIDVFPLRLLFASSVNTDQIYKLDTELRKCKAR